MLDFRQQINKIIEENWSIIPLEGTGANAKRPAHELDSWAQYQQAPPAEAEIDKWFNGRYTAYGIIMGSVMGGFVIDFDDPIKYHIFCKQFPTLAESYTVQTRKGYHVYLRTPYTIKTARFDGGDIIGNGSYVVGAASTIMQTIDNEDITTTYNIRCDNPIQNINNEQWHAIQEHLNIVTITPRLLAQSNQQTPLTITPNILITHYEKGIQHQGRNNTLYSIALQAKHNNINQNNTIAALANHHASTPAREDHPAETYEQRHAEAIRTIQSAYKTGGNNALQPLTARKNSERQLPNNLREALLHATGRPNNAGGHIYTSANLARLIEGLHHEGYLGTITTNKTIGQIAKKYNISHGSLRKILAGEYNGLVLIKEASHSQAQNIFPVREGERKKNNQIFYAVPSLENLLERFQVIPQISDHLSDDDLRSNKAYLQALHREFIKRCGPDTSTAYCAARLSVTPRTILNYDQDLNILKTAIVHYEALNWHNVDEDDLFPATNDAGITPGMWLQRADGKRFPAIKGIALSQLKAGAHLVICKQKPSARYLPDTVLIYHEVWWVAPDGSRWGGAADAFPPQATTIYAPKAPIEPEIVPLAPPKRPAVVATDNAQTYYRLQFEARDRQRIAHITAQVQQARQTHVFHVDPRINMALKLIKGIGDRIDEQLGGAGIEQMTDLIIVGADRVAEIFHYNAYINNKTTQGWIDQAQQLLGLCQPTPEEQRQAARDVHARQQQEQIRHYKQAYKQLQTFITNLLDSGERDNRTLQNFQIRLQTWTEHPHLYTFIKFDEVQTRIIAELTAYQTRIQTFLEADDDWLNRWCLGSVKYWRKRAEQVQKQLQVWQSLTCS